ncbi:hypothetical protein CEXT_398351 [Caerostris extrusa]|uniref:Uncharacterized protein n=1 Tax=Caerostris extrusa TaxID=172846 RepID=A0AAV4RQD5_CAEEX|nr:hypothetical protein CEXT_398351 [Caerostris extrusa]
MYAMWFVLFLLVGFTSDVISEESHCPANSPIQFCKLEVNEGLIPWNREELNRFCTRMNQYFNCFNEFKFSTGDLCGWAVQLHHMHRTISDMCKNRTSLAHKYLMALPCYKKIKDLHLESCNNVSEEMVVSLGKFSTNAEVFDKNPKIVGCIRGTTLKECLGLKIFHECGREPYYLFRELDRKSHYHLLFCKNVQHYKRAYEVVVTMEANREDGADVYDLSDLLLK